MTQGPVQAAVLAGHVAAGAVALLAGLGAIVTEKGGRRHVLAGRVYVAAMAVVVATAVPLSVWIASRFLLAVAVFSGYLVFGGARAVRRRRSDRSGPTRTDYLGHGGMVVVGAGMVAVGLQGSLSPPVGLAPVLAVFGAIGAALAVRTLAVLRRPVARRPHWLGRHVVFVGGGYIATVTATVTVNLGGLPPLVRWLGPTVVGVPLLVLARRRYVP